MSNSADKVILQFSTDPIKLIEIRIMYIYTISFLLDLNYGYGWEIVS